MRPKTFTGIQSGPDVFEESWLVMTFLTNWEGGGGLQEYDTGSDES